MNDWGPLILTFKLAIVTTLILFLISIPLAFALNQWKSRWKAFVEALVSLPLVLPPTVLGFYFLVAFSPENVIGGFIENWFDVQLLFTFSGLVLASIIYSLPFMVHPIQSGLSNLPKSLEEASILMGKSRWETLTKVQLPNIKTSILTGIVLTFAHTVGEFGVVLMIGGNIPNKTKVVSIAIFEEVEALNYGLANKYSLILIVISFIILLLVYLVNGKYIRQFWK